MRTSNNTIQNGGGAGPGDPPGGRLYKITIIIIIYRPLVMIISLKRMTDSYTAILDKHMKVNNSTVKI